MSHILNFIYDANPSNPLTENSGCAKSLVRGETVAKRLIQCLFGEVPMSGYEPVDLNQFVARYIQNNKDADADAVRAAVEDALAAWSQGVRCACGSPLWVAGSAVAGYGCFTCITGSAQPDGDPEIDVACDGFGIEEDLKHYEFEMVNEIIRKHPRDYRERLEAVGFQWTDDDYDLLFEEEVKEEQLAVPETENQRRLVRFLTNGGAVTRGILEAYLKERYSETSNLPLVRKYFKRANPHLKAILLKGLAVNPTDLDLLDDLSYFSEFDSMLGELIQLYTDACLKETDMERFSLLAQDFHINTVDKGFDALHELTAIFPSGTKGAVIQHLCQSINHDEGQENATF